MQIDQQKFREFFLLVVEREQKMLHALNDEVTEWRKKVEEDTMAIEIADLIIEKAETIARQFDEAVATLETDADKAIDLFRKTELDCKEIDDAMRSVRGYGA
ncbi:hypothetical protein [Agrobacterium rosae]|uniref:hypothetical protein n=1 Tax=Agrobacterium rosae TaxID=1972867 RepID=UPI0020340F11|nr:hypothetical protein [Agrobacterium rosae]MCM2433193.1 hypothetical protein [Agrobacterium rosae]